VIRCPIGTSAPLFLLVLSLAACAPHDVRRATGPLPPVSLGLAGPAAPTIDQRWWLAFGDPQLDRIMADAFVGSPSLDKALARLRQARASVSNAEAATRPTGAIGADVLGARLSRNLLPFGGEDRVETIGLINGNLAWNLDLFGRQAAAIREAKATAQAASLDLSAARLALASSIAQTYVNLTLAEQQAAIARDAIGTRRQSLHLVQVQVRNKLASQLQIEAANTLLAQAQEALVVANRNRDLATHALAALAGKGVDYAAAIQPSRLSFDTAAPLPAVLPADLLSRRPDIAAARARIDAAHAGRQEAKRAYYPNVNLMGLVGLQAIGLGNLFSLDAVTAGAGPAVTLPIFEGGKLRAGLERATADLDRATADYNDSVVGAVREAADALTQVTSLSAQRTQSGAVVHGFSETQRLNAIRIQSGLESRLDTVDTDIRLLDARLTDINIAAAAAAQRITLIAALGGGFDPRQDPAP
jgi:NodT family efflux transporter outer membrane factor (OMF) lipoprotein